MDFIKTPVKGMCDMLPSDMRLREHILKMIKDRYALYGFMEIETPVMEHIENLTSNQGGENEKLIFKVMKRGEELERAFADGKNELADMGLRYDLTVPLARYYANNKDKLPAPFKALQIGNVWRADNPQKGRFRQFTQCDIDILGDDTDLAETELIAATSDMLSVIFSEAGITDFTIHINDRRILRSAALQAGFDESDIGDVLISLDKYDKIGTSGIYAELSGAGYDDIVIRRYLAIYDNIGEDISCRKFCENFSEEYMNSGAADSVDEIISCVRSFLDPHVKIVFDPTLVRGMGYYTGTIFEITMDGYGFSIAGGGRYDKMIGRFCGQDVAACGFSIGFERIITILKDKMGKGIPVSNDSVAILIGKNVTDERKMELFAQARDMRAQGTTVTVQPMRRNMKQQIEKLEAEGFQSFEKIYE